MFDHRSVLRPTAVVATPTTWARKDRATSHQHCALLSMLSLVRRGSGLTTNNLNRGTSQPEPNSASSMWSPIASGLLRRPHDQRVDERVVHRHTRRRPPPRPLQLLHYL